MSKKLFKPLADLFNIGMKLIAQGAESRLYAEGDKVIKERFRKTYRIPEIDERLRKFRAKREARILEKLASANFPSPRLISFGKDNTIVMSRIEGSVVKDIFEKDWKVLSGEIGKKLSSLHNLNIIHGDLTTSNMIFCKGLYFIDFGLSFFSHKPEDKAVDIHLLKEALASRHYLVSNEAIQEVIKSYKKLAQGSESVLRRLEQVEKRGRYKQK